MENNENVNVNIEMNELGNNVQQFREQFINELLDRYKDRYRKDFTIHEVVVKPNGSDVVFNMISSDDEKFSVSVNYDMTITDNYQQAECTHQIESYMSILIPDTYIKASFIEDFEPESSASLFYEDYIVKHRVEEVLVDIFAPNGTIDEQRIDTVHQAIFKKVKVPVTYILHSYDTDKFQAAVDELKDSFRITGYTIECTEPASEKAYRKENGEI